MKTFSNYETDKIVGPRRLKPSLRPNQPKHPTRTSNSATLNSRTGPKTQPTHTQHLAQNTKTPKSQTNRINRNPESGQPRKETLSINLNLFRAPTILQLHTQRPQPQRSFQNLQ